MLGLVIDEHVLLRTLKVSYMKTCMEMQIGELVRKFKGRREVCTSLNFCISALLCEVLFSIQCSFTE